MNHAWVRSVKYFSERTVNILLILQSMSAKYTCSHRTRYMTTREQLGTMCSSWTGIIPTIGIPSSAYILVTSTLDTISWINGGALELNLIHTAHQPHSQYSKSVPCSSVFFESWTERCIETHTLFRKVKQRLSQNISCHNGWRLYTMHHKRFWDDKQTHCRYLVLIVFRNMRKAKALPHTTAETTGKH